jgi:hypothetical protein
VEFVFEYLPSLISPSRTDDLSAPSTTTTSSARQSPSVPLLLSQEETIWLSEHRSDHSQVPPGSSVSALNVLSPPRHNWPLEDEHEARLLQYFVTDLASWVSGPDTKSFPAVLLIPVSSSLATAIPLARSLPRLHNPLPPPPRCATPSLQLQLGNSA